MAEFPDKPILRPAPVALAGFAAEREPKSPPRRAPIVRYLGFHATAEGRAYTLEASGGEPTRRFVLTIPHAAFLAHEARFQDAPDLCSRKLTRALEHDPDLLPGDFVITAEELSDYRIRRDAPAAKSVRRAAPR
jgi:hypothetical protein